MIHPPLSKTASRCIAELSKPTGPWTHSMAETNRGPWGCWHQGNRVVWIWWRNGAHVLRPLICQPEVAYPLNTHGCSKPDLPPLYDNRHMYQGGVEVAATPENAWACWAWLENQITAIGRDSGYERDPKRPLGHLDSLQAWRFVAALRAVADWIKQPAHGLVLDGRDDFVDGRPERVLGHALSLAGENSTWMIRWLQEEFGSSRDPVPLWEALRKIAEFPRQPPRSGDLLLLADLIQAKLMGTTWKPAVWRPVGLMWSPWFGIGDE